LRCRESCAYAANEIERPLLLKRNGNGNGKGNERRQPDVITLVESIEANPKCKLRGVLVNTKI
jgi:hypothetical protein